MRTDEELSCKRLRNGILLGLSSSTPFSTNQIAKSRFIAKGPAVLKTVLFSGVCTIFLTAQSQKELNGEENIHLGVTLFSKYATELKFVV